MGLSLEQDIPTNLRVESFEKTRKAWAQELEDWKETILKQVKENKKKDGKEKNAENAARNLDLPDAAINYDFGKLYTAKKKKLGLYGA